MLVKERNSAEKIETNTNVSFGPSPPPWSVLNVYLPSFSCRLLLIINWDSTRPNLAYHLKILGLLPPQLYGKGKSDTINTGIIKTFENIKGLFSKLHKHWELIRLQLVRWLCDWVKIIPDTSLTNHESRILLHLAQVNHLDLELLLVLVFIIIFFDWSTILVELFKTFSNKNYHLTPLPDRWTVQAPRVELCCWYSRTMDTDTLFLRHPHWNIVPYAWLFSPWPQRIGRILASSRYASCDRSCWHGLPSSGPPGCKGGLARHHSRTFCRGIAITRSTAGQKRL